jgi:CHAT domain-containing protein
MNKNNITYIFYAKKIVLITLFITLGYKCFSQNVVANENSIKKLNEIIEVANIYSSISDKQDSALYMYHKVINTINTSIDKINIYTYTNALSGLSNMYKNIGNNDSAHFYVKKIIETDSIYPFKSLKNLAMDFTILANFYLTTGNPSAAIPIYKEISNILIEDFGVNNESYYNSIYLTVQIQTSLAYSMLYNYQLSDITFLNALQLCKNKLGISNTDYALIEFSYSSLNAEINNYPKAIDLIEDAAKIIKETEGESNSLYCDVLSSSIPYYIAIKDYDKANFTAKKVLNLINQTIIKNDLKYYKALNTYANTEKLLGNFEESILIFNEAKQKAKFKYGKTTFYGDLLNNFAEVYLWQGGINLPKCEDLLKESLNLYKEILEVESVMYQSCLINLVRFYAISKDYNKSDYYLIIANDYIRNYFKKYFFTLNFQEQVNFLTTIDRFYEFTNQYVWAQSNLDPIRNDLIKSSYNNELATKGSSLRNLIKIKDILQRENKTTPIEYLNLINSLNLQLLINNNSKIITDSFYTEKIKLEELLIKEYKSELIKSITEADWIAINNKLKNNEAVIDFFNFNTSQYDTNTDTDKFIYGVRILSPKLSEPIILYLFITNKEIDQTFRDKPSLINKSTENNNPYNPDLHIINNLIWKNIDSLLSSLDISTVYISPTGILHNINLVALPTDNQNIFWNIYNTHILGSPVDVINYKPLYLNSKIIKEFISFGDIEYDKSTSNTTKNKINEIGYPQISEIASRSGTSKFAYLPGTKKEIQDISKIVAKNNMPIVQYTGQNASEENFKQLNGKNEPYILHIATHGFFFPNSIKTNPTSIALFQNKNTLYKLSDDPLLRSGLILSGANATWGKTDSISTTTEDGILTSYEIANTDLSGCQLVVLSACETGLGDINASEGVFGLQRAFKMAGVKNIIMSLWKVDDNETPKLMNLFYNNCFKGESVHDALQHAQNEMKINGYAPYYWAGFKLLE